MSGDTKVNPAAVHGRIVDQEPGRNIVSAAVATIVPVGAAPG